MFFGTITAFHITCILLASWRDRVGWGGWVEF